MPFRRNTVTLLAVTLAGLFTQCAHAQGYYYGPQSVARLQGQIMGGYSGTSGNTGTYLDGGWAADAGFIYWLQPNQGLGLRTDLSYSHHQATDQFLAFGQQAT